MPNKRVTELTEVTTPSNDALVYVVNNATGTAVDQKAYLGAVLGPNYINGLSLTRLATNSIRIETGLAILPNNRVLRVTSPITFSSMSLLASTWYHVYLYLSGSSVLAEYVTASPATPYFGTARTKTGDTSRRYIGSFLTNSSAQIHDFSYTNNYMAYRTAGSNFRILNGGTALSLTAVSLANAVPGTATLVDIFCINIGSAAIYLCNSAGGIYYTLLANSRFEISNVPIENGNLYYYVVSGGSAIIDVMGYTMER
jgi:hypothetical protein